MKTLNSVSGGKSSAFVYANFPADINIFSLVLIEEPKFKWMLGKDEKTRQHISDRLNIDFVGTAELDTIIYTILDLEQQYGHEIKFVSGMSFEALIRDRKGYLPSHSRRFCTTEFKIKPIFDYLQANNLLPIITNLGFRKGEESRKLKSLARVSADGFEYHITRTTQKPNSRYYNRENVKYRKLQFPLIDNGITEPMVKAFWADKKVRFATHNNCIGCVNRSPIFLNHLSKKHPVQYMKFPYLEDYANKINLDHGKTAAVTFRPEGSMQSFINPKIDFGLFDTDFNDCDTGYCGL